MKNSHRANTSVTLVCHYREGVSLSQVLVPLLRRELARRASAPPGAGDAPKEGGC